MPSYNRVILIGRLTRDPEIRYTATGLAVTKFSIAVDRRFKNQQGERVTDFFDCSAFRQKAEFVNEYVKKGRLVAIDGAIEMNDVTGQDGQKRRYINIICDNVETLDAPREVGEGAVPDGPAGGYAASRGGGGHAQHDEGNGYFPDEEPAAAPPQRAPQQQAAPQQAAPRQQSAGGAPSRPAPSAARPQPSRQPAADVFPEDDFDDSDPFADE